VVQGTNNLSVGKHLKDSSPQPQPESPRSGIGSKEYREMLESMNEKMETERTRHQRQEMESQHKIETQDAALRKLLGELESLDKSSRKVTSIVGVVGHEQGVDLTWSCRLLRMRAGSTSLRLNCCNKNHNSSLQTSSGYGVKEFQLWTGNVPHSEVTWLDPSGE